MKALRTKKFSSAPIIIVLAAFAVCVFSVYTTYLNSYLKQETQLRLVQSVEQSRYYIERTIDQTFDILNTIAAFLSMQENIIDTDSMLLLQKEYNLYKYGLMLIITPDGTGYGSNSETYQLKERKYFKEAMEGSLFITEISENLETGEPSIVFSVPIKRKERVIGVFAFGFPFSQFNQLLKKNALNMQAVSYITLKDKTIITRTAADTDVSAIEKLVFSKNAHEIGIFSTQEDQTDFFQIGDVSFFASYISLSIPNWYLLTVIPSNVYFSQSSQLLQINIIAFLILVLLLFSIIAIVFFMQHSASESLRRSEERYRIVSEQADEAIFEWDLIEDVFIVPENVKKKFLFIPEDKKFKKFSSNNNSNDFIYEKDIEKFINLFSNAANGSPYCEETYRVKRNDSSYGWVRTRLTTLFDAHKKPYKVVGVSFDVDNAVTQTLALQAKAERDSLTQLYNKGYADSLITNTLIESVPEKNKHAFFLIDIDDFKSINDTFGHLYGDKVLSSIGSKLKKAFRQQDIPSRIGGDEFAVFLRDIDSDTIIIERAEKLQEIFKLERTGKDEKYKVSGSIGIALYPQHGTTYAELYEKADKALYKAKHLGKDRYQICTAE